MWQLLPGWGRRCARASCRLSAQTRWIFFAERDGALYLDLWLANAFCLRKAGVVQVEQSGLCTAEHLDEWYSYRKEKGITGRFAVVIGLKHDEH